MEGIRSVVERYRAQFILVEWWVVAAQHIEDLMGTADVGHGGAAEMAAMLHYRPELVRLEEVSPESFETSVPGITLFPLQKTANAADASAVVRATPEKMEQLMAAVERQVVEQVLEALATFSAGRGQAL